MSNVLKLKLPKNPKASFKHTSKKSVWDKFYGWVRINIGMDSDFKLDVSRVHSTKKFNKLLESLIKSNVKAQIPTLKGKRFEVSVAMEMLNYSPSERLSPPEDEIWVEVDKLPIAKKAKKLSVKG